MHVACCTPPCKHTDRYMHSYTLCKARLPGLVGVQERWCLLLGGRCQSSTKTPSLSHQIGAGPTRRSSMCPTCVDLLCRCVQPLCGLNISALILAILSTYGSAHWGFNRLVCARKACVQDFSLHPVARMFDVAIGILYLKLP